MTFADPFPLVDAVFPNPVDIAAQTYLLLQKFSFSGASVRAVRWGHPRPAAPPCTLCEPGVPSARRTASRTHEQGAPRCWAHRFSEPWSHPKTSALWRRLQERRSPRSVRTETRRQCRGV